MKLVQTLLRTQLKQTNLENRLHVLTESPKKGFNDTVFQHFIDELKHCNSDMQMDLQLLVPVFWCLYMFLSLRMIFLHNLFCSIFFLVNLQYFHPLLQDLFAIFNENLLQ